jgi:hypothetical protein
MKLQIMPLTINIAEPCKENWLDMTQLEQGAYCKSCCKEVIDFSSLTDTEILNYIEKRKSEKMCGRFRKEQLNKPLIHISPDVLYMNIPLWKKFLAAFFICFAEFLTGCESKSSSYEDIPLPTPPVVTATSSSVPIKEAKRYIHLSEKDSVEASCIMVFGDFTVTSETQIKAPVIKEKVHPGIKY